MRKCENAPRAYTRVTIPSKRVVFVCHLLDGLTYKKCRSNDWTSVTPATIPKQPGSVAVASGMLHLTFHVCAISIQASQPLHLSQGSLPARETTPEWKLCKMQTKKWPYPESPHSWDPHSWLASKRQPSSIKRVWAATKRWTHAWSTASPAARLTLPTHVLCRRRARTHARTQT